MSEDTVKTKAGWDKSELPLTRYLQVGDMVDDGIYRYVLNILPPAFNQNGILQMGEPAGLQAGGFTFLTLQKTSAGWTYAGTCYRGKTEPVA